MLPAKLNRLLVQELWKNYDVFLLDCDGVIWRGSQAIQGVSAAIDLLHSRNKRVILLTNNSTRSPIDYVNKCKSLKINFSGEENVVASSRVTAYHVKKMIKSEGSVYMIGGEGLARELTLENIAHNGHGPDNVDDYVGDQQMVHVDLRDDVRAVVAGFDKYISYAKLVKAASYLKRENCSFVATNDDAFFPSGDPQIVLPGAGSIVHSIAYSSQRKPTIIGKPHTPTFEYIKDKLNVNPERALMVGDWPATDIRFARRHGMASLLVLSGNATIDHVQKPLDAEATPNYYCQSLYSLCELDQRN